MISKSHPETTLYATREKTGRSGFQMMQEAAWPRPRSCTGDVVSEESWSRDGAEGHGGVARSGYGEGGSPAAWGVTVVDGVTEEVLSCWESYKPACMSLIC